MNRLQLKLLMTLLLCSQVASVRAAEPESKLSPGSTITIQFPQMPATFYDVFEKKTLPAQMTIFLPTNYEPGRKWPLLIFLNGGDGGAGASLGVARALCNNRDFVCVSVPLFKTPDFKADKSKPGPDFIINGADGRYMWPFFRAMLEKLDQTVPNLDPARQILGGFSNGAHATAALIDQSDGQVARRFHAFLFVEGGGKLQHYDLLKGKPFLMVSSNSRSRPRAQQICDAAKAAGAKAKLVFEDVGAHDFPRSAYPAVSAWLGQSLKD